MPSKSGYDHRPGQVRCTESSSCANNRRGNSDRSRRYWWWSRATRRTVRQRQRIARAVLYAQALRQRGLLRHLRRNPLVERGVVVDAVSCPDQRGGSEERAPGERHSRLQCMFIGLNQRARIPLPRHWTRGVAAQYRRFGRKSRRHVQVHQPAILLYDGRVVFPPRARIDGEPGPTRHRR